MNMKALKSKLDIAGSVTIKNVYYNLYIVENIHSPSFYISDPLMPSLTKDLK